MALVVVPALAILAAFVPAFIWLWLFVREDRHPEPNRVILRAFIFGAFAAAPALGIQLAIGRGGFVALGALGVAFLAAIEELAKFGGAFVAVRRDAAFDEPVDAMVYAIAAALGFATVENILAVLTGAGGGSVFSLSLAAEGLAFRSIGATLLHTLAGGLIGYGWARGIRRGASVGGIAFGIMFATVAHAVFNLLLARFQDTNTLVPTLFLVGIAFFVFRDFDLIQQT